jgi:hypothetical protein
MVTFNGETKNVAQWATHLGIPVARIRARLIKLGWSDDRALSLTKWDK